jgi:hypothetical protein
MISSLTNINKHIAEDIIFVCQFLNDRRYKLARGHNALFEQLHIGSIVNLPVYRMNTVVFLVRENWVFVNYG